MRDKKRRLGLAGLLLGGSLLASSFCSGEKIRLRWDPYDPSTGTPRPDWYQVYTGTSYPNFTSKTLTTTNTCTLDLPAGEYSAWVTALRKSTTSGQELESIPSKRVSFEILPEDENLGYLPALATPDQVGDWKVSPGGILTQATTEQGEKVIKVTGESDDVTTTCPLEVKNLEDDSALILEIGSRIPQRRTIDIRVTDIQDNYTTFTTNLMPNNNVFILPLLQPLNSLRDFSIIGRNYEIKRAIAMQIGVSIADLFRPEKNIHELLHYSDVPTTHTTRFDLTKLGTEETRREREIIFSSTGFEKNEMIGYSLLAILNLPEAQYNNLPLSGPAIEVDFAGQTKIRTKKQLRKGYNIIIYKIKSEEGERQDRAFGNDEFSVKIRSASTIPAKKAEYFSIEFYAGLKPGAPTN